MVWASSMDPEISGIGDVKTKAAAATARSQTSVAYRREMDRPTRPLWKPAGTVTPKKISGRVTYGATCDASATRAMKTIIVAMSRFRGLLDGQLRGD